MTSSKSTDLHIHTVASDGTDTVQQRIRQAEEHGLNAIAITDHDNISEELDERKFTAENDIEVITGAEIKCEIDGIKIEILGYFVDPKSSAINQLFDTLSEKRISRMKEMVRKLNGELEENIQIENVLSKEETIPGRPHLAQVLVENNIAEDMEQAFNELIGSDSDAYVEVEKIPAHDAIKAVHESGGVAVLAHPGRSLKKEEAVEKIGKLVKDDLDGIEVEYSYRQKIQLPSYKVFFTEVYANKIAEMYDLIPTGGSDCHGSESDKFNIGKVKLDYNVLKRLEALTEEYR